MIQKSHIENFLRINSISISAPDDEIRQALQMARWSGKDVDIAISILRNNGTQVVTDVEATKLFYSDERVSPQTITSLFKVHIQVPQYSLVRRALEEEERKDSSALKISMAVILSLVVAIGLFLGTMYALSMGPFYTPV